MKILYAEDDLMMQKIVVRALIRIGYEVTTVDDGQEAIEAVESEGFDLIILDVFMPRFSGFEVVEHIRKTLKKDTQILMISRIHIEDVVQKAYAVGANGFIGKPFIPEDMIVKITKMLVNKR